VGMDSKSTNVTVNNDNSLIEKLLSQIFIVGTAISLFITVILGFFIARTITKPITDMRNQTVEMSKGNYTQRVKIYGNDEIG
ncbi:HAMP domain-containing protein, partial [Lentilactobacillus parakefiri]